MYQKAQAGQDIFVYNILGKKNNGTFLDLGANDPLINNNTYFLYKKGWTGIGIDIDPVYIGTWNDSRGQKLVAVNLDSCDWDSIIKENPYLSEPIDFLSIDVDDSTVATVNNFPFDKIKASVITIEHDSYRVGHSVKNYLRTKLSKLGYFLLHPDVMVDNYGHNVIYEDWWVDPTISAIDIEFKTTDAMMGVDIASKYS